MVSTETGARAGAKVNTGYGWVVLGVVFLAGLCAPANMAKVTTLAPILMEVFGIGPGLIGWVIALFYVLGFVMSFPTAGLANKFGIKKIVIAALCLSIVGGVIGAFSTSLPLFMASRVLEGAGMGIMGTIGIPAISPWFAPSKQGLPMGIWGMWVSVPMFVGPIVYTAIYESTGAWQPVWYFTIGLSVVALVVFSIFYKDPTYRFDENEQAVALDAAQGIELEKPSIKRALKLPVVWVLAIVILLDNSAFMAVQGFMTTYVYDFLGVSLGVAAALVSAAAVIGAVMSPVAGAVSPALPLADLSAAGGGRKFTEFHCVPSLFFRDLQEVAYLGYLAAGLGIIGLHGLVAGLAQSERVGGGDVLVVAPIEALDELYLELSHCTYPLNL